MRATAKRANLTKAAIEKLPLPDTGRIYVYDTKQPGLSLCLTAAGSRTWYLYRKIEGKPERIRLGPWPEWPATKAREEAAKQLGRIADGDNPAQLKRERNGAPTFKELFDVFIELPTRTKAKRPKSAKTIQDYRLQFGNYLAAWHNRQLSKITRADVETLHNRIAQDSGQYAANRVLSLVKVLFNTAADLELHEGNPASRVRAFEEEQRERFLQADELPRFWKALEAETSEKVRDFFKVALFTGQRRSNIAKMRWENVDLSNGMWTLPSTKTGKHAVPLVGPAVEILAERLQTANEDCPFVFPGRHGVDHLRDPTKQWREIKERAGITDLRIHDLRRSLGSWQAIGGASLQVIGKTLGHTRPETTQIYSRLSDAPVRDSMESAIAAMIAAATPKKTEGGEDA